MTWPLLSVALSVNDAACGPVPSITTVADIGSKTNDTVVPGGASLLRSLTGTTRDASSLTGGGSPVIGIVVSSPASWPGVGVVLTYGEENAGAACVAQPATLPRGRGTSRPAGVAVHIT